MTKLEEMRHNRGYSRMALAIKSKVSAETIRAYETGRRDIRKASYEQLKKLAEALGCGVEDIFD